MDKCRQQSCRCQRSNMKSGYQRKMYGSQDSMCNQMAGNYSNSYKMNHGKSGCVESGMEDCPGIEKDPIAGMPLAMAYVPWQRFENLYDECEALYHGTLFGDLDLDFCGKRCE